MSQKRSFYSSIQYCRGIAALIVVIAHAIEHPLSVEVNALAITGRLGVVIFFVVSGFIISAVCGSGSFNVRQFLFRRFMRVAPLYWGCTLMVALTCLIAPQVFKTTLYSMEHLLLSLAFVPHANPRDLSDYTPLLKLGWTLNYEMFFYAAMGSLFFVRSAQIRTISITALFIGLIAAGTLLDWGGPVASTYCSVTLIPFLTGVWLAAAAQGGILQKTPKYTGAAALALAVAGGIVLYQVPFESINNWPNSALIIGVAALTVAGLLQIEIKGSLPKLLILEKIGDSSYSLYLTHIFVVGGEWYVARRLFHIETLPVRMAAWLIIIVSAIVVGHLFYLKIEKPLMRWSHHVSKSKAPALARAEA